MRYCLETYVVPLQPAQMAGARKGNLMGSLTDLAAIASFPFVASLVVYGGNGTIKTHFGRI